MFPPPQSQGIHIRVLWGHTSVFIIHIAHVKKQRNTGVKQLRIWRQNLKSVPSLPGTTQSALKRLNFFFLSWCNISGLLSFISFTHAFIESVLRLCRLPGHGWGGLPSFLSSGECRQIRHCVTGIPSMHSLPLAFLKERMHRTLSQWHCREETSRGTGPRSYQREGGIFIYRSLIYLLVIICNSISELSLYLS